MTLERNHLVEFWEYLLDLPLKLFTFPFLTFLEQISLVNMSLVTYSFFFKDLFFLDNLTCA